MIRTHMKIPIQVSVAVSGGSDSMAVLDFLRMGRKDLQVLHFNHGTTHADIAQEAVERYCEKWKLGLRIGKIQDSPPAGESMENFWRERRYEFFYQDTDRKVITCHHLDDVVETWIFTSLHGTPRLIPQERDHIIRPFLTTPKEVLAEWCHRKNVEYVTDPTNQDTTFMRNFIRHELVPRAVRVNPGIKKTIRKKLLQHPAIY